MKTGMGIRHENFRMVGKLAVVTLGMFAFGYALVPIYKSICEFTGINILALTERDVPDYVEVDTNKLTAKLARIPVFTDVPYPVQMEPHLIVEFYSR